MVLHRLGVLFEEPMFLLRNEVKEPSNYVGILSAIAKGNTKLDRIAGELGVKGNTLSPYLESLVTMGILERRVPVTEEGGRSRNGRFFIKDGFLRFWFRFVFPHMTSLARGNAKEAERDIDEYLESSFISSVFADISREYVRKGHLGEFDRIGSYWDSKVEIDVLALDMVGKKALVGECVYSGGPVPVSVSNDLIEKAERIPKLKDFEIRYALFSASGFEGNPADMGPKNTVLVDIGDSLNAFVGKESA